MTTFTNELPVLSFYDEILHTVDQNQVTIITAETGAGKSTQVPQYLADHGYTKVVVTQPRILAARNLSSRVREEWAIRTGKDSDEIIGYRTAHERDDSLHTNILYCTDGLQLVREITGSGIRERQILVLDEVHEWNENMEVLVAWAKKRCQEEPHFKVVIMSATIETGSLAEYFDTTAIINIPGRSFPVKKQHGSDLLAEVIKQVETTNNNVLVFLPGKAEIQAIAEAVQKLANNAGVPIIPLHSQLEVESQQQAFASFPNGKVILATNIAQTSITIDDIDVVIDSGLERRSEVRSGVEGLFIGQISQADCLQRAGRAGRTKPGEYILAQYDVMPCLKFEDREEYATPEILRKHIDRLTLRLANVGIDIEMLDFYHDPSKKAIHRAKHTLISLGALTKSGEVTKIGRKMEQFPVESSYARMLIESEKYSKEVQAKLATIIAIQEVGGIVRGGTRYTGWRKYAKHMKSDLLAQYDVFLATPDITMEDFEELGIIGKNITKANEVEERLHRDLGISHPGITPILEEEQEPLLKCIVAGLLHLLWEVDSHGSAVHITAKKKRELSSSTVVRNPRLVAGTPFDLQVPSPRGGLETLHLVQGITAVNTAWLLELAPDMFSKRQGKIFYDARAGSLAKSQLIRFGGRTIEGGSEPLVDSSSQYKKLFIEHLAAWLYDQLERERRGMGKHRSHHLPHIPLKQVQQEVAAIVHGVVSTSELDAAQRKALFALAHLDAYTKTNYKLRVPERQATHHQKRRKGWQPRHKRRKNEY